MTSSDASSPCRLEWRPSRWLPAALCALAIAAVTAVWMSALPPLPCAIASAFVVAYTVWRLRRELHHSRCELTWPGGDADWRVECEGREEILRHDHASIRGGIAVLTLIDASGRRRRYVWWPDTLDARGRRAFKLALAARAPTAATQAP